MYSIYPQIISKIYTFLKKLRLSVLSEGPDSFVERKKRFYWAICKTDKGKKVFFKSLLKKEEGIKNRFKNEINFFKVLGENPWHPLSKITPKPLTFSIDNSFPYLLYEFVPGEAGTRKDRFSSTEIRKIIGLIKLINSSENIFDFIPKKPLFDFRFYKKTVDSLSARVGIRKNLRKEIKDFIEKEKRIFHISKHVLTHGDFSEANLIFYKGKIKIADWEHVHLRNPLYDFVSFWTKRKRQKKEQKIIEREYLKNEGKLKFLSSLFKLALIEISLRDLIFFEEMLKILQKEKENETIKKAKLDRRKEIEETLELLEENLNL